MGYLKVEAGGSFPFASKTFSAMANGHAHAVAQALQFLTEEVLPEAIERDHRLHEKGSKPSKGYDRP